MSNSKEPRLEMFDINRQILIDKILPLVKDDELKRKIKYCFRCDYSAFFLGMPIWHYGEKYRAEANAELDRIYKEHGIRMFD